MESSSESGTKRIERVILACVQCRNRHVRCDATQPICNRCKRDGKECNYQKSRRGGLDKAALAQRRLRLQQAQQHAPEQHEDQAGKAPVGDEIECSISAPMENVSLYHSSSISSPSSADHIAADASADRSPAFHVNENRLFELYYENFWSQFPFVLPLHHLQQRRLTGNHGMGELLLTLQYIGSIFAPWTPSEPYMVAAIQALTSPVLAPTPFVVQALMLLALAQFHSDMKQQAQNQLLRAVNMALELQMNQQNFARAYGESNPVLEESWRRTYYMLNIIDQTIAVISNSPLFALGTVPNMVDLPCEDEHFASGQIPLPATWHDYEDREFADVEIVFSSLVYYYDLFSIVKAVMDIFFGSGTLGEDIVEFCDTKIAIWTSLLPACKRDPLRKDGTLDEVMFAAHMNAITLLNTMHRPFSSLGLCQEELTTRAFLSATPYVTPPKQGRGVHTARSLKALEMQTKLLAIPCTIEKHNVFTMCMSAQLAVAQISACKHLLEDYALSIARDRVRLSIGFLNAMGTFWPLGKMMAREVRRIARVNLTNNQSTVAMDSVPAAEIEIPRDELIWPVSTASTEIDIYTGITLPMDWETVNLGYSSSGTPSLS